MQHRLTTEDESAIKHGSISRETRPQQGRSGLLGGGRYSILIGSVITLYYVCSVLAGQRVTARISGADVRQISNIIGAITREPIISIDPVYSLTARPGAVLRNQVQLVPSKDGKIERTSVTVYEFTDQVSVRTGSCQDVKGRTYELKRTPQGWKIVFKGTWIH